MFPEEVVPYEWESIREAALEALGRGGELVAMYQERLDDTYDPNTEAQSYEASGVDSSQGIGGARLSASAASSSSIAGFCSHSHQYFHHRFHN